MPQSTITKPKTKTENPPVHYFHLPHKKDLFTIAMLLFPRALPHTEAVGLHAQRAITAAHTPHSSFYSSRPSLVSRTCSHCITNRKNESAHICVLDVLVHFGLHVTPGRLKSQIDLKQDQCSLHGHTLKTSPCWCIRALQTSVLLERTFERQCTDVPIWVAHCRSHTLLALLIIDSWWALLLWAQQGCLIQHHTGSTCMFTVPLSSFTFLDMWGTKVAPHVRFKAYWSRRRSRPFWIA